MASGFSQRLQDLGGAPATAGRLCGLSDAPWQLSQASLTPVFSPWPPQASCILQLVKHVQKLQAKDMPVAEEVSALFAGELNPVAPKAQKKVPVPEG